MNDDNRTPVTSAPPSPDVGNWRRFQREAVAGDHGAELAGASFLHRNSRGIEFAVMAVLVLAILVVLSVDIVAGNGWFADIPWWGVGLLVMNVGIIALLAQVGRRDSWRYRARERYRLRRFAAANGLSHEVAPPLPGRRGAIFDYGDRHTTTEWCAMPTATGFEIANLQVTVDPGGAESYIDRWGYVVFTLRQSLPHALLLRPGGVGRRWLPTRLRDLEPIAITESLSLHTDKPDHPPLAALVSPELVGLIRTVHPRAFAEIVADELYLYIGGGIDLASPTLWRDVSALAERLAPELVTPPNVELMAGLAAPRG